MKKSELTNSLTHQHNFIISEWRFDRIEGYIGREQYPNRGDNMSNTYENYSPRFQTASKVVCSLCLEEIDLEIDVYPAGKNER